MNQLELDLFPISCCPVGSVLAVVWSGLVSGPCAASMRHRSGRRIVLLRSPMMSRLYLPMDLSGIGISSYS